MNDPPADELSPADATYDDHPDAGVTALHYAPVPPPYLVGPTTTAYRNTLQPPAGSTACVGVDSLQFQFASSFVRPSITTSMRSLAALLGSDSDHKDALLSVFGHADRVGSDDNNKRLSGRRAKAVYGLLIQHPDVWEALYSLPFSSDTWGDASIRTMLGHLGFTKPSLAAAVGDFQDANGLPNDGDASTPPAKPTRTALFKAYMAKLMGALVVPATQFLVGAGDPDTPGDVQGCSEFNPVWVPSQAEAARWDAGEDRADRDERDAPNRRVLILLYKHKPDMTKWPCPPPEQGAATCKAQFGPDGDSHRTPDETEKARWTKQKTFACLWYERQAGRSPCDLRGPLQTITFIVVNDGDGSPVDDGWVLQLARDGATPEDAPLVKGRTKVSGRAGQRVAAVRLQRAPGTSEDIRCVVKVTRKTATGATTVTFTGVSLDSLLEQTMFGAASGPGLGEDHLGDAIVQAKPATPKEWDWANLAQGPAAVGGITYDLPADSPMGHAMTMKVLDAVVWHDVGIDALSPAGVTMARKTLELKQPFLMRRRLLPAGASIAGGSSGWWQLPAKLDSCLLLAYGYEVDYLNNTINPVPSAAQSGATFMPPDAAGLGADGVIGTDVEVEIRVIPLRVLVVAELMPCSLAADFEPFGVLDAARIFPHLMVRPSFTLKRIEAQIDLMRPATTTMPMEATSPNLSAAFFCDSNDGRLRPFDFLDKMPEILRSRLPPALLKPGNAQLPLWDALFDYYDTNPPTGTEFKMVDWSLPARAVVNKVDTLEYRHIKIISFSPGFDVGYVATDFSKVAGQGEFDNVHMAPKMIYSKYPSADVAMAPICAHDCLHTHWRWGKLYPSVPSLSSTTKGLLGFDGFNPNQVAGAPMVPVNQTIKVSMLTPTALAYKITIEDQIGPAQWQVMMHHGSAYAVKLHVPAAASYFLSFTAFIMEWVYGIHNVPSDPNQIPPDLWALIYFTFRYQDYVSGGTFLERVRVRDLAGARTG